MPGIGHQESSVPTPPRRSTDGAPGERFFTRWTKGVSGSAAEPDRAGIALSEVLIPRKPRAVDVAATAAGPPALTVALSEAGVRTIGPLNVVVVVACMSTVAEAVATAVGSLTAHTAASAATRAVKQTLGMMHSSWIRTYTAS
jgi:hypothetical protein